MKNTTNTKIRSKIPTVQAWFEREENEGIEITLPLAIMLTVYYFFFCKHVWIPMLMILVLIIAAGSIGASDCVDYGICP